MSDGKKLLIRDPLFNDKSFSKKSRLGDLLGCLLKVGFGESEKKEKLGAFKFVSAVCLQFYLVTPTYPTKMAFFSKGSLESLQESSL